MPLTLLRDFGVGGDPLLIHVMASDAGRLKYGGCPSIISINIIPSDHISTLREREDKKNN